MDTNGNGTTRTSDQDHISIPWLERTVMDELSRISGQIERIEQRQGFLFETIARLQRAHDDTTQRILGALTFVLSKIDRLGAPIRPNHHHQARAAEEFVVEDF